MSERPVEASRSAIRTPSRLSFGEGNRCPRTRSAWAPPGGVEGGGTRARPWVETGKGSSSRGENPRKQGSRASREAKRGEDESLTDGPVVAKRRGNARGAKGPYRRQSEQEARQERDDKAHHQSAGALREDRPPGEVRPCAPFLGDIRYRLHEPRCRRALRGDADSLAWNRLQRAGTCSPGGGGTHRRPMGSSSSSCRSRARVPLQYLGASSR